jgi:hypothetical protein
VQTLSIRAAGLTLASTCAALSLPLPAASSTGGSAAQPLYAPQASTLATQALPPAYNWCDQGGCTPVRDQGSCGSCWAFATVGALESALEIRRNLTTDLSEQYLLSCNTSGFDCGGGWFAHDYHWFAKPSGEPEAGAVLEYSFPYQADDVPCNGPYSHPHRIASWHYVSDYAIPSTESLKQTIYDHGPVAAAVCIGDAFRYYTGDVFRTDESAVCGGDGVNHAVLLVGWDDSEQAWILRNSWNTDWGEGGYMRIGYQTSNVGYAANYVIYEYTPLIAADWVYLPLAAKGFAPTPTIANGGFEDGRDGSWAESSSNGWPLVTNEMDLAVSPHDGRWAAWLGGGDYETSILSQEVAIPPSASTLSYWSWRGSTDYCGYDFAYVRFGSTNLAIYDLCASANTDGWEHEQVDVTGWRGQAVVLRFVVTTDWSQHSNLFLDDVRLLTTEAQLDQSPPGRQPLLPAPLAGSAGKTR